MQANFERPQQLLKLTCTKQWKKVLTLYLLSRDV